MSEIEVRLATPEEHGAAGDLTAAAYLADGPVPDSYVPSLRNASARAAAGQLLVAVDRTTGALLGTASLFSGDSGPAWAERAQPGDAVLRMLAVAAVARRRGIGRLLTLECVDRARAMGCRRLLLSTRPTMTSAHRLYERLGFRRDPAADWEPEPGVPLLAYWLPL